MTRVEIMGLPIDALTTDQTVRRIFDHLATGHGSLQHIVLNAAKVVEAHENPRLRSIIDQCNIVNADGMSIVWASHILGTPIPERVAGIDLMERLITEAASRGTGIYLLGARPHVLTRVAQVLQLSYPSLRICGAHHGYWSETAEADVVDSIRDSGADLLFVALPSPRKEEFLAAHREEMAVPFVMGVGGSFDVIAGQIRRAPVWMQTHGLEWLYRLMQEPRRMLYRYAVGNARFVSLLIRYRLFP